MADENLPFLAENTAVRQEHLVRRGVDPTEVIRFAAQGVRPGVTSDPDQAHRPRAVPKTAAMVAVNAAHPADLLKRSPTPG